MWICTFSRLHADAVLARPGPFCSRPPSPTTLLQQSHQTLHFHLALILFRYSAKLASYWEHYSVPVTLPRLCVYVFVGIAVGMAAERGLRTEYCEMKAQTLESSWRCLILWEEVRAERVL